MEGEEEGVGPSRLGSKLKACRDLSRWVGGKIGEHCRGLPRTKFFPCDYGDAAVAVTLGRDHKSLH